MKKHIKIYHDSRNITPGNTIYCEICGAVAVDIHHIDPKGMGGSKIKDIPENLIAVCRKHHLQAHGQIQPKISKEELREYSKYIQQNS